MSALEVCRVCLSGNVKVHAIKYSRLQVIFESLTSAKLSSEDGRPETVCYICYRHLQRCIIFTDKSKKSGDILSEILHNGIQITPETITTLTKGVQPTLSVACESTSYNSKTVKDESISDDDEVIEIVNCSKQEIKSESSLCRGCLAADLRTADISNTLLHDVYEKLTKNQLSQDLWPASLCYICVSQLRTARKIVENNKKSEYVLSELIYNGVQLTQGIISILNRRTKLSLTKLCTQNLSYSPDEDLVNVKEEMDSEYSEVVNGTGYRRIKTESNIGHQIKLEIELPKSQEITTNTNKKTIISNIDEFAACDICDFKTNSEFRYKRHIKMHDPDRRHPCNICHRRYLSKTHLDLHKKTSHKNIFKCRTCKELFWNRIKYKNHILTHTAKELFPCEKCSKLFTKEKNLRTHYYNIHSGIKHPCDRCKYTSSSYKFLQDHIIRIHGKTDRCICDFCHKTFANKKAIKHHLLIHYETERYECDLCFKTFSQNQTLKSHYKTHSGEKPYKCDNCDKAYVEKGHLARHVVIHGKSEYSCSICHKEFFKKYCWKTHMTIHNIDKLFECDYCEKKFINGHYLRKHMQSHSYQPQECMFCDKYFRTKATLRSHIKFIHGNVEKTFSCDICDKSFTRKQNLIKHLDYHLGIKRFPCNLGGRYFATKQSMITHRMTHTGEKNYKCEKCGKAFVQRPALNRHIRAHNKDKPHSCNICGKSFAEKLSLRTHKLTQHDTIKRFICDICYKVFLHKKNITTHIKNHKRKPFSCRTCKKSYLKLSTLTQHMRVHPIEFFCAFCKKEFDTKSNLHRHNVKQHNAVSRYACNVCEKPIESLLGLNAHIRTHTGEKPFSCELCEKTYVERRDLLHHLKIIHNVLQWFN